jgi:hypothetical protein
MEKIYKQLSQVSNAALCIALCLAGGYLLSSIAVDSTIFNADSAAPYYQAKLITSGIATDPKALSFARIPSIFPDLGTLIALTNADKSAAFHIIFARYSWIIATTFIFLQAEFTRLTLSGSISRANSIAITIAITTALANSFPLFKETIGILVTPLHHGGNIIATYLLGCILVWDPEKNDTRKLKEFSAKPFLAALTISVGIASNKLLIMTGIAPAAISAGLASLLTIKKKPLVFYRSAIVNRHKVIILLFVACLAGLAAPSLINTQCSLPIVIRPLETYKQFFEIVFRNSAYALLGAISTILLAIFSGFSLANKSRNTTQAKTMQQVTTSIHKRLFLGSTFLFLSTLSPLAYLWLLGDAKDLPIRYFIITGAGISLPLIVIASKSIQQLESLAKRAGITAQSSLICLFLTLLLLFQNFSSAKNLKNIEEIYASEFLSRSKHQAEIVDKLQSLKLTTGLSDFWGTELEQISGLRPSGATQITIEPILNSGKPDLWAYSIHQFLKPNHEVKEYNFVVSTDPEFERSAKDSYGEPTSIVNATKKGEKILIYSDSNQVKNISNILESKLANFKRQCNRKNQDFTER